MKIFRFRYRNKVLWGILKEENLYPVQGSIFDDFRVGEKGIPIGSVSLLPPVQPSKIVAVGVNYRDHALEMGRPLPEEPLLFLKPPSAVIGPGEEIIYPRQAKRVDYEGEVAVVIKKETRLLTENDDTDPYVLGYTCFNDVTARDLQFKDVQFTRAKSFDTFAPIGPCIAVDVDPGCLRIKTFLNGKLKQSSTTRNLIFSVSILIRFISGIMTLFPGDVITTGTPAGVGPMMPGDRIDIQIEGIGTLSNTVRKTEP
ncbi:MAG: fumarylacetoacetate hydrolase family protein [Clostridiales bacterium]|jgi:2-keto-4-pentenoate hydratase/2-oxohepta-3-ene-1,7-dioic acid hydratase in catechol pathway|nr:fumarylacetoacetate hydrolase family protein [Clostridiales bacterium]